MKKTLWLLIIFSVFLTSACVQAVHFEILNSSDEEIEIQYELQSGSYFEPEEITESSLNRWKVFKKEWNKLPKDQYSIDEKSQIMTLKVKPHQAIKIGWMDTFYLNKDADEHFPFNGLKIKGQNKDIYFENGTKLLDEFKKNHFRITYK